MSTAATSPSVSDSDGPESVPAKAKGAKPVDIDDDSEEDEYQVEKILSHSFQKGQVIYEIKWLGYEDEADRTWEPVENLYAISP